MARRDDEIISAINSLEDALENETERKSEVRDRIDEVTREFRRAESDIERLARERDDYRAVIVGLDETLEEYFEADTDALGGMDSDLRDLRSRIHDLDIEGGSYTGGDTTIDIDIEINQGRRDFLGKGLAGAAVLAAGAFGYETWQNSREEIGIAEENIGSTPVKYDANIANSEVIEDYVSKMIDEDEFNPTFTKVAEDINGERVSMGYLDEENRVDFYNEKVVSSVEMNNQLYQEAKDEMNETLYN